MCICQWFVAWLPLTSLVGWGFFGLVVWGFCGRKGPVGWKSGACSVRSQLCECWSQQTSRSSHWGTYSTAARVRAGWASWLASHPGGAEQQGGLVHLHLSEPRGEPPEASFLLQSICPVSLLTFGCCTWLPWGQPGEKIPCVCHSLWVTSFWQSGARAHVCYQTPGVMERFWLLACFQESLPALVQ